MKEYFKIRKENGKEEYRILYAYKYLQTLGKIGWEGTQSEIATIYSIFSPTLKEPGIKSFIQFMEREGAIIQTSVAFPHFTFYFKYRGLAEEFCKKLNSATSILYNT